MSGENNEAPVRRMVTICNKRGLHARAAAKFVKLAETYDAD
jgi:phosphocarrier protein